MNGEHVIREATAADLPVILLHRRGMFADMGNTDAAVLDAMQAAAADWTRRRMESGEYRGWLVAGPDGHVIAGAGLWVQELCSSPRNLSGRQAYLMNVYTEPGHRLQGWARKLMQAILVWCRHNGCGTVALHASDFGRPFYQSLGFQPTNEMRLRLGQDSGLKV